MNPLEQQLVEVSAKLPPLSENVKSWLVKYIPWIHLVFAILLLPVMLAALGLSAIAMPFAYAGGMHYGSYFGLGLLLSVVTFVLELVAIPGLFKRSKQGWNMSFYAVLVSGLSRLLYLNLGSLIVGTGLSLYVLFQIRSHYMSSTPASPVTPPTP